MLTAGDGSADWVVIAYARSDCKAPDKFFDKFYALLEQQVTEAQGVLDDTKYTVYSRSVLALTAMGKDPHNVGGYDLLEPLADVDTVAGLITHVWGKFPRVGECIDIKNFHFKVLEANERRVHLLELHVSEKTDEE